MKNFLLPYPYKFIGWFLVLIGVALGILYVWFNLRFIIPVFAVYSSYLETKMFVISRTNFADELILTSCLIGFFLIVFSVEKNETENLNLIRAKALIKSFVLNNVFLFLSVLFVYGYGFVYILIFNVFSFSVFYLLFFYVLMHRKG
ncbi:MAG: hypothetical protein PHD97_07775 [Bacteroidales bacterium]|nr:hypothetical protein [Bacteroidales bacterium]